MPRMEDEKDGQYALGRVPGRLYIHGRFPYRHPSGNPSALDGHAARFAVQVSDETETVSFENENCWELKLRTTKTRQQLKALFFEDDRRIETLAFQRFKADGSPMRNERFTIQGPEIDRLLGFLALVQSQRLDLDTHSAGIKILPEMVKSLLQEDAALTELLLDDPQALQELLRTDIRAPDVVALARRQEVLRQFELLLRDEAAFVQRQQEIGKEGREAVWQDLFEANPWILGFGAAPQFLHAIRDDRLEQILVGSDLGRHGKRPDAAMRTASHIRALVLVEIKHDNSALTRSTPVRPGTHAPATDLVEAVAQCQQTADAVVERYGQEIPLADAGGFQLESIAVCRPRSVLVVGSGDEFFKDGRPSQDRMRSFERYRRSLSDPEIITFDELLERARMSLSLLASEVGDPPSTEDSSVPSNPES